jgi:hypothetical protein
MVVHRQVFLLGGEQRGLGLIEKLLSLLQTCESKQRREISRACRDEFAKHRIGVPRAIETIGIKQILESPKRPALDGRVAGRVRGSTELLDRLVQQTETLNCERLLRLRLAHHLFTGAQRRYHRLTRGVHSKGRRTPGV